MRAIVSAFHLASTKADQAQWDAWLSKVLQEVAAKTRLRWQLVNVDGSEVLVVAVERAKELIRIYEKPRLVCYLRIGDQTVPIDDTLFADLALGRRVKAELELTSLSVVGGRDSTGSYLNISVTVSNRGLLWVPDIMAAWVGYSYGPILAPESIFRNIDVRPPNPPDRNLRLTVSELRKRTNQGGDGRELRPFESAELATKFEKFPAPERKMAWVWCGAILLLPKNESPLWGQLASHGIGQEFIESRGWVPKSGTAPVATWTWDKQAEGGFAAVLGDR